jgi:AraC-like DNA-binding protein
MTATIDLALAMIEHDLGVEVARSVARKLVVYHRRTGGQSQFSALLELDPKSDRIQNALHYAKAHLRNELSVEELAEVARLSPRQFSRAFRAETGQSPAKAIEQLRVEAARELIGDGRHRWTRLPARPALPTANGCGGHSCGCWTAAADHPPARPGRGPGRRLNAKAGQKHAKPFMFGWFLPCFTLTPCRLRL